MPQNVTRRGFGALIAASGIAAAQQQTIPAIPPTPPQLPNTGTAPPANPATGPVQGGSAQGPRRPPDILPFEGPLEFARKDATPKVQPFPMAQVRLLAGPFQEAQEWNRGYMSRLGADRLVRNFRLNAGLPSSAKPFGGWEEYADPNGPRRGQAGELRGHFTGHFLSASALLWASTGDKAAKAKGDEMVDELAQCQKKLNTGGYLSAFPTELFDRLDARKPVWAPFYTFHKIMAGMFDMYQYAGNKQALEVVTGMADWADKWTASKTEEHMQSILQDEFGGMAETFYNLTAATGDNRWARAGDRFQKRWFINPLALHRDELRGLHMNTHVPQAIAAARRYEISGDYRFHEVADFFWTAVVDGHTYVTAGSSNGELWHGEPHQLAWELRNTKERNGQPTVNTAECCCAYNMLKLTRHLYQWTRDPRYFDYYERSLLNHRLGTIEPKTGHTQYYLSLALDGARKVFNSEDQDFWCCTGTGVEEYSKLTDSIYWRDADGLFVNLFIPSELNWEEKGFRLRQETSFPSQPRTALVVTEAKAAPISIRLRIPAWLQSAPTVKINGKALDASAAPGSYLTLNRTWKAGDRVEMELPLHLSAEPLPDDPSRQAVLYGPLVLAGDLGPLPQHQPGDGNPSPAPSAIPVIKASGDVGSWVKPGAQPMTFTAGGMKLAPLNSIFDRRYLVYLQVG